MTLLKYELSHPWFKNYRAMVEERARDYYAMVYADSPDALRLLRDKYGLDYIIFDPWNYRATARRKKRLFYEPLKAELQNRFPMDDAKEYFLERLARHIHGVPMGSLRGPASGRRDPWLLEKPGEDPAK